MCEGIDVVDVWSISYTARVHDQSVKVQPPRVNLYRLYPVNVV